MRCEGACRISCRAKTISKRLLQRAQLSTLLIFDESSFSVNIFYPDRRAFPMAAVIAVSQIVAHQKILALRADDGAEIFDRLIRFVLSTPKHHTQSIVSNIKSAGFDLNLISAEADHTLDV